MVASNRTTRESASVSSDQRAQSDGRSGACETEATIAASRDGIWLTRMIHPVRRQARANRCYTLTIDGWLDAVDETKRVASPGGINNRERKTDPPRTRAQEVLSGDRGLRVIVIDSDDLW